MRLALTLPRYWPEVYRGTERIVHDIAVQMASRGHDVSVITSHLEATAEAEEEGVRVLRVRRPPYASPMRWYEDHLESAPGVAWRAARGNYDLVNAFVPSYAWAAVKARRLGGPPVVFSFHGIPERRYLVYCRYRLEMLQSTLRGVTSSTVLSHAAAAAFRRYLLAEPQVLPAGYLPADFEIVEEREAAPTLVCAASLSDPRKRGALLLAAFAALRERRPDARLRLVHPAGTEPPLGFDLPEGAAWVQAGNAREVASAYATGWASVLPAVGEALGLVMIESMATGTPVVAARSGAGPEIVSNERVGRLFEADNQDALVGAMDEALDLARDAGVAQACRERVAAYRWNALIGEHEDFYLESAAAG